MSIEAMKQALEALEYYRSAEDYQPNPASEAITALRQAIEQAEKQEFVGVVGMDVSRPHMNYNGQYLGQKPDTKTAMLFKDLEVGTKLYAAPVYASDISQERVDETAKDRHEWVGLTDDEIEEAYQLSLAKYIEEVDPDYHSQSSMADYVFVRAIEAKLKEKNNG